MYNTYFLFTLDPPTDIPSSGKSLASEIMNDDFIHSISYTVVSFQRTVYTVSEADQSVNVCLSSLEPVQEPITIHLTTIDRNATGKVLEWCLCHHSTCYAFSENHCYAVSLPT